MGKGVQIALAIVLAALAGMMVWLAISEPEPIYQPVSYGDYLAMKKQRSGADEATPQIGANAMTIRIAGLNTNISPAGVEWGVAVPKSRSHRPAVLFWSVQVEETNKSSPRNSRIILSANELDLMSLSLASNEDGILTWTYGQTLNPEKVYRAVGAYWEPKSFQDKIWSLCQRAPTIGRFLPQPKPQLVTSEWFEVTSKFNN